MSVCVNNGVPAFICGYARSERRLGEIPGAGERLRRSPLIPASVRISFWLTLRGLDGLRTGAGGALSRETLFSVVWAHRRQANTRTKKG